MAKIKRLIQMEHNDMFVKNMVYCAGHGNGYYLEYAFSSISQEDAQEKARKKCWEKTIADDPEYWKGFVQITFLDKKYD